MTKGAKVGLIAGGALLLMAAFVVATVVYVGWDFAEGVRLSNLGFQNIRNKEYDEAIRNFTSATKHILLPATRYWVYVNRALADKSVNLPAAAVADLTEAIRLKPDGAEAYEQRGLVFEQLKEIQKGLADFDRAISLDPNRGMSHLRRGTLFYNKGEFEKAESDLREVCRIWPNYSYGYLMLGRTLVKQGNLETALADFDTYLRVLPSSRIGYEERAKVYQQLDDGERAFFDTAEAQYLAAQKTFSRPKPKAGRTSASDPFGGRDKLNVDPLPRPDLRDPALVTINYYSLMTEGMKAREAGNYDKAMGFFNKALGLDLDRQQASTAMISRADCFWSKGEFDEATRAYDEATKLAPDSAAAYFYRATNLEQQGDVDGALKDFEQAIRLYPRDYRPYAFRGLAFFYEGDFKNALIDFAKSLEISPTQDEAYCFRARLYTQRGELDKAIADCSSAIEFHPESYYSYGTRARAYLRANRSDLASNDLTKEQTLVAHEEIILHEDVAWLRATCPDPAMRDSVEAVREAQRACEMMHWKHWFSLDVLAAAEAEAGNFAKAIEYAQDALDRPVPPVYRGAVEARLNAYKNHRPFRDSLPN